MIESNKKYKVKEIKRNTKVAISTIALASILLSGCSAEKKDVTNEVEKSSQQNIQTEQKKNTTTVLVFENGNIMIVDVINYIKYATLTSTDKDSIQNLDDSWVLYLENNESLIVNSQSVLFVTGKHSHEKALIIAEKLVSEYGNITTYEPVTTNSR